MTGRFYICFHFFFFSKNGKNSFSIFFNSLNFYSISKFRFAEDGAQYNFIRDTETNASCPCIESQARVDIGRFMPHPRCSQVRLIEH